MKKLFLLFCFSSALFLRAENLRLPDIRAWGMGANEVMLSTALNPALIPLGTNKAIDLSYTNRYLLKELGTLSFGFQYPNDKLSTSLHVASFGYDEYRETMFRLAVGKRLGAHWALGIAFQYVFVQTALLEYTPGRISTDVGIVYSFVDKLSVGLLIKDLPSVCVKQQDVELECFQAYSIQLGFQYEVFHHTLIACYAGTNQAYRVTGGIGLEYELWDAFRIRGGVQIAPLLPTFGVGVSLKAFQIDAATLYHPVLGVSLGIGLSFHF